MVKYDSPQIKSVEIKKERRFWNITVDGKLVCIALYKRGAETVQELIQRLAGLPVTADAIKVAESAIKQPAKTKAAAANSKAKAESKSKIVPAAKAKPAIKNVEAIPTKPLTEATPAVQ